MSHAFFSRTLKFPDPAKVRCHVGYRADVEITVSMDPPDEGGMAQAEFEVTLMDVDGYMEADTIRFSGCGERTIRVPFLSTKTKAVYIVPKDCTTPGQAYSVRAFNQ